MVVTNRPRTITASPTESAIRQPSFAPVQPTPQVQAPPVKDKAEPSKRTITVPSGLSVDPALLKRAATQRLS